LFNIYILFYIRNLNGQMNGMKKVPRKRAWIILTNQ